MEGITVISISHLLHRRRPISGAVSLQHSTPPPSSGDSKTLNPNTISHTKILNSLSQPSVIIGILCLPIYSNSPHHCFSFSDDSGSLCCDVLQFDFRMIKRKIRVIAWNFIPLKQCGGLLEIISWDFVECSFSGNVESFHLDFGDNDVVGNDCDTKSKYSVCGVLGSISPVSSIPCSDELVSRNLRGFILEVLCCDCRLCKLKDCVEVYDDLGLGSELHSFSRIEYVFFCGSGRSPYLVFLKLIGSVLLLSGMRKKLVYIGKDETRLMSVSTEMTSLCVSNLQQYEGYFCQNYEARIKGNWKLGMYTGVVKSTYMQGMIVELDEDVWLLLTDESLLLPHSVRVGSIISVRNVHIVNPKFPWGKMLILGGCCKTSISTISFSPLETGCQPVYRFQSLLGNFMESLVFPARLWALLLVQCLKKKFSGVFSEREILGTKHKEGLVQTYARSILPSSVFQSWHGSFKEFCRHEKCGSGSNIYYGSLSLAMPFSYLVNNCERMFIKALLQMNNGIKIVEECSQVGHPFREKRLSYQFIRRILPSKDIGVSLLGNLKICPATGRLQYIDGTGIVDAVIPDIPSAWDINAIYEVFDYSLVLEGRPEIWGQLWMLDTNFFSCGSLFETIPIKRRMQLTVYLHFSWSNVNCRHFIIHPCLSALNSCAKLDPGTFHLFYLTHKLPLQSRFHGDISGKTHLFAEGMVLPWDLNIGVSNVAAFQTKMPQYDLVNGSQDAFSFKRCKTHQTSKCTDKVGLCNDEVGLCNKIEESENRLCDQQNNLLFLPHKTRSVNRLIAESSVQCTITGRELHCQGMDVPATLRFTDGNCGIADMVCSRKVLLEFNSENLFKYKFLQIGGIYIMKHCVEKCLCDSHRMKSSISIASETKFWSLSFQFGEAIDCSSVSCNDLSFASHSTDFHVAVDAIDLLDMDIRFQGLKKLILDLSRKSTDTSNIDSIKQEFGCENTMTGLYESQGMYSGSGLPEGNLISLQGTIVRLCNSDGYSMDRIPCNSVAHNIHLPNFSIEKEDSIYLLVLTDGQMLQISGCLSKLDFPVGLGPGAVATFHRILALRGGQNCFLLTPVSFVTINSVREVPTPVKSLCSIPEEIIASSLISDLIQYDTGQPRSFKCSIVAVYFVMLERNINLDKLLSQIQMGSSVVNIPLAGFILDDGSSHCCCWTNGERAATFLRLYEEIPQAKSGSYRWRLKAAGRNRVFSTPSYHLNRILKKHGRLCVKNYGSLHDTSCQDILFSDGSDCTFGSQDENLLKYIMLNACSSTLWNVTGHVMDSDAVSVLEKNLLEEHMTLHALQNVWAREVCQVNPLAQAKDLFQDL